MEVSAFAHLGSSLTQASQLGEMNMHIGALVVSLIASCGQCFAADFQFTTTDGELATITLGSQPNSDIRLSVGNKLIMMRQCKAMGKCLIGDGVVLNALETPGGRLESSEEQFVTVCGELGDYQVFGESFHGKWCETRHHERGVTKVLYSMRHGLVLVSIKNEELNVTLVSESKYGLWSYENLKWGHLAPE